MQDYKLRCWTRRDGEALRGQLLADVTQLLHRAKLDLTHALASDVKLGSDFLQRALASIVQSESQSHYVALSSGQPPKNAVDLLTSDKRPGHIARVRHV